MSNVLDFSTSHAQIADEIINVSDANPVELKSNTFYNKTGKLMIVRTAAAGGGTLLVNPLSGSADYTPGDAYTFPEPYNTTLAGDVGYQTIAITNATYHNIDLFVSYYPIWDLMTAARWNNNIIIPHYKASPYDISSTTVEIDLEEMNSWPIGTTRQIKAHSGDGSDYLWFTDNGETINGIPIADIKIEGTGGFILTKISDGVFQAKSWLGGEIWDHDAGNFNSGNSHFEKRLTGSMRQTGYFTTTDTPNTSSVGWYRNDPILSVSYALSFVSAPVPQVMSAAGSAPLAALSNATPPTVSGFGVYHYRGDSGTSTTLDGSYTAEDRWTSSYAS